MEEKIMKFLKNNYILILIITFGIFLRIHNFGSIPGGLNQDEASIGYEAYAISEYGIDRNGDTYPVYLTSWGTGQNALYAYLLIPIIKIFGLTTITLRSVSLIFSLLSMLVFYLIFKRICSKKIATIALFMLAINPWHIMVSRWGLESNLFPMLFLIGIYFLLKLEKKKYLYISTIIFAISLYSYGVAHLFVPLFLLVTYLYLIFTKKVTIVAGILNALLFCAISMPIILFILINQFNLSETSINIGIFTIPKLYAQRTEYILNLKEIYSNFENFLDFVIGQSDGNPWNAVPNYGFMYLITLPFTILGIADIIRKIKRKEKTEDLNNEGIKILFYITIIWLLMSIVIACIVKININRLNIIIFPLLILAILGIKRVLEKDKMLFNVLIGVYIFLGLGFTYNYSIVQNEEVSKAFYKSLDQAICYAEEISKKENKKIFLVEDREIRPMYIHILYYNKINPNVFVNTREIREKQVEFYRVKSFDKYEFDKIPEELNEEYIYIADNRHKKTFEENGYKVIEYKYYLIAEKTST